MQEIKPDCIILASCQHTGTNFLGKVLGGGRAKIFPGEDTVYFKGKPVTAKSGYRYIHGHFDCRTEALKRLAATRKTVIPIRHPLKVAVSWKMRGTGSLRRTETFLEQWVRMDEFPDAFFFPMETKPFDELSEYLGFTVNRTRRIIGGAGYEPPEDPAAYLGKANMKLVKRALATEIGRRFYGAEGSLSQ